MYSEATVQLESLRSELTNMANSIHAHITHTDPKVNRRPPLVQGNNRVCVRRDGTRRPPPLNATSNIYISFGVNITELCSSGIVWRAKEPVPVTNDRWRQERPNGENNNTCLDASRPSSIFNPADFYWLGRDGAPAELQCAKLSTVSIVDEKGR